MKTFYKLQKALISLILFFITIPVFGESFRVAKLHVINIQQDTDSDTETAMGLNDALAIYLPEDKDFRDYFIEGIEIKMSIPEQTALWRDCCACYIYENISPLPKKEQIDFTGNKVYFGVLPGKLSWVLQIPFTKENKLKTTQYTTTLDKMPDISNNFIFLRLQQIMKGVPDSVMNSKITVSVKPILSDKGKLKLKINDEITSEQAEENSNLSDDIQYSLYIDDEAVNTEDNGIILNTGIHNLSIISENYRTEVRTVRIDQAKTTELEVQLKSIEPTIIITTPDGTEVLIDEEPCTEFGKEFFIAEGDHKIKFIIGDYEITRSISIIKGKTYKVNLAVDLQIDEQ